MKERPSISNTSKLVKTGVERGKSKVTRKVSLAKGEKGEKNHRKKHN